MSRLAYILLFATVVCEVAGQVCFKLGVDRMPSTHSTLLGRALDSLWVRTGIAIYTVEFLLWVAALSIAPLNRAVPIAALSYAGVVFASRWILREPVSTRRWVGTLVVAAGVALICLPEQP